MDGNIIQDKKKYAVVKFLSDDTFSEIPTAWICKEGETDQCWWPPQTANSAILIANCASPNTDTWSIHEIELIKYCSSLESARKSAFDAYYHTTDDERLGRGKKQLRPYNRYSSDEEHEETQLRKLKRQRSCNRCSSDEEEHEEAQPRKLNIGSTSYQKKRLAEKNCSNAIASTLPSCPDNFGLNNNILFNVSQKSGSCFIEISSQKGMESVLSSKQKGKEAEEIDIPITFDGYIPCVEDMEKNENIQQNLQQMLRMQATANITLQDINQRLQKLEKFIITKCASNFVVNNDALIKKFLPCTTVERIQQFESLLKTTEEAVTQFREYLLKTGGNNPRDNIQRILKKIFTNECASNCSMKGRRNNFRVGDLNILKIVRRDLTSRYVNLTEFEFDGIVAEWLRFAKQRKEREDKIRKEKDNEENNIQHYVDE